MPFLSYDDLLAVDPLSALPKARVPVPEWQAGAEVWVRVMMGYELELFNDYIAKRPESVILQERALVCALTMCTEQGERLCQGDDINALTAQIAMLCQKSQLVLHRIYDQACKLNLLREHDWEEAKKKEHLVLIESSHSSLPDSLAVPSENSTPE
jgi:hypothetical protein